jgi:hypothetical protein
MANLGICCDHFVYFTPLEIIYGRLVYFVVIWSFLPVLVFCTKKNLATLVLILRIFKSNLLTANLA